MTDPGKDVRTAPHASDASQRWKPRVRLAWLVRAVTVIVPFALSMAAALYVGSTIRTSDGWGTRLLAWAVASVVATAVLLATDRIFRRLVPLAVLLRLSLVFPDRAPSRFSTALRACAQLRPERELARLAGEQVDEDPGRAAERIVTLLGSLNAHDRRTRGHSERVRAIADLIGAEMGLGEIDADRLRWAALLHDIGKLRTSPRILQKPSGLTEPEWEHMRRHPAAGARIAAALEPWLGDWWHGIGQHHERWDGSGYPAGLAGADISLAARIVAVADSFEVMTAPRAYRLPVSLETARRELVHCSGSQFDPGVVRAFLSVSIGRLHRVMGPLSWLGQVPLLRSAPRAHSLVTLAGRQASASAALVGAGVVTLAAVTVPAAGPAAPPVAAGSGAAAAPGSAHHATAGRLTLAPSDSGTVLAGAGMVDSSRPSRDPAPAPPSTVPKAAGASVVTAAPVASRVAKPPAPAGPAETPAASPVASTPATTTTTTQPAATTQPATVAAPAGSETAPGVGPAPATADGAPAPQPAAAQSAQGHRGRRHHGHGRHRDLDREGPAGQAGGEGPAQQTGGADGGYERWGNQGGNNAGGRGWSRPPG